MKEKKMLPIRCFSCNKILGHFSDDFENGTINKEFLKKHGISRYCCQKILLTSVDIHKHLFSTVDLPFCKQKPYTETTRILTAR